MLNHCAVTTALLLISRHQPIQSQFVAQKSGSEDRCPEINHTARCVTKPHLFSQMVDLEAARRAPSFAKQCRDVQRLVMDLQATMG